MMGQKEFLAKIIAALEGAGIEYMLSGSIASSFHGRPRATNDIDIVIACSDRQLTVLESLIDKSFYMSSDAARDAVRHHASFNIIDPDSGWKADLIIRKERPYSVKEFSRRWQVQAMGLETSIVSPEDAIISKLEWSSISESERQFKDALGVAITQFENLDRTYLEKWAMELGVLDRLARLLDLAAEFNPPKKCR